VPPSAIAEINALRLDEADALMREVFVWLTEGDKPFDGEIRPVIRVRGDVIQSVSVQFQGEVVSAKPAAAAAPATPADRARSLSIRRAG
jgi:hypothetical protein